MAPRRSYGSSAEDDALRCVIPAKAGIQSPGTRGQVWMPAFAGMTLTFLSHPPILNDSYHATEAGSTSNLWFRGSQGLRVEIEPLPGPDLSAISDIAMFYCG